MGDKKCDALDTAHKQLLDKYGCPGEKRECVALDKAYGELRDEYCQVEQDHQKIKMSLKPEEEIICREILKKLDETNQLYIPGFDYPISVSGELFKLVNEARKKLAKEKNIPEVQMEFEDLLFYLITK